MLSQEREVLSKLSSSVHQLSPAISSPIVISSQDSASTNSSPLPVYPSFTPTQYKSRTFENSGALNTNTSHSWRGSCVLSDKSMPFSLDRQSAGCLSSSDPELNDDILPQKVDDEYMEEEFESYCIPDNFDDFQEDSPHPQRSSSLLSAADLPKSQMMTGASTYASSSQLPLHTGNCGGLLASTSNTQRFQPVIPTSSGSSATKDNSTEFCGQYRHTKEMFKVFTQVHV